MPAGCRCPPSTSTGSAAPRRPSMAASSTSARRRGSRSSSGPTGWAPRSIPAGSGGASRGGAGGGAAAVVPADLAGIVAGTGPGGFTGLRVGLATAKTLAHGLGIPIAGIATTDALAAAALAGHGGDALVLLPAGPSDRYLALVRVARDGTARAIEPPRLLAPADVGQAVADAIAAGARLVPVDPADAPAAAPHGRGGRGPASAFRQELETNRLARHLVARAGGQARGSGGIWLMVDEAHITTFAVLPAWRREGIGARLLLALLDLAVELGATVATLEVRLSNIEARHLYERFGFMPVGVRPRYYSDNAADALLMSPGGSRTPVMRARLERLRAEVEPAGEPSGSSWTPDDDGH